MRYLNLKARTHRTCRSRDLLEGGVVLDGEIWLELEDGVETCLRPFDVFVQNGTRHAWRNKSSRPATFAVALVDAAKDEAAV